MKPKIVSAAHSTHSDRSKAATVSAIAPRPSSFRIARVLPPCFSASLATRAICARIVGDLQPVERGAGAGLALHMADIACEPEQVVGLLDLHRFTRRARGERRIGRAMTLENTFRKALVSTTERKRARHRFRHAREMRPVLRAAFTSDSPMRAGAPTPSEA